jgi:ABC-2 type transport system ATP-binding protein
MTAADAPPVAAAGAPPDVAPLADGDAAELAVMTRELRRVYRGAGGTVVALDGVDLRVRRGELYGVLGPNGAGKTTLIKVLVTLLLPTSGVAFVDGLDVVRDVAALRRRIAMVSGGENSGYGPLTVREQLWMYSQLHGMPGRLARPRIEALLQRMHLAEAGDRRIFALSSGMRQKMNLIRGFITDPRVLFLDEPTVALDVGAARDLRQEIRRWMAEDPTRTVILTTHHMLEADELCDRLAIVTRGRVVAEGTPAELKRSVREALVVDLTLRVGAPLLGALRAVDGVSAASVEENDGSDTFTIQLADDSVLTAVLVAAEAAGRRVMGVDRREPTLEDAFVRLVGRSLAEEEV